MNNTKLLQAMALDLKRCAIGYYSNSNKMADRFFQEVCMRTSQLDSSLLNSQTQKIVKKLQNLSQETNFKKRAEDCLMYSTILLSLSTFKQQ